MGFLFGSEPETEIKQYPTLSPGQQTIFDQLLSQVGGQVGVGVSPYPGTYTPGPSETQNQIFDLIGQLLGGRGPLQPEAMGTLQGFMEPYNPEQAYKYWEKGVKAPMMESWEKDIVPGIMENFAAYDAAGSGPARKAVSESGRRLETDMGSILANILSQYEENYKNRAYSAAKTGLSYPETLVSSLLPAATEQRNITAQQEYEKYQDWLMSQPWANPWLQYAMPLLNVRPFENIATQSGGQQGIFGDLLKAGASLGSAWIKGPSKSPIVLA